MRFSTIQRGNSQTIAIHRGDDLIDLSIAAPQLPRDPLAFIQGGVEAVAAAERAVASARSDALVDPASIKYLPLISNPGKIICVGLNYVDHSSESGFKQPEYPTIFARFASSLIAHQQDIIRPLCSTQLDYEGEMVAIVGQRGREIEKSRALDYIAGYSIFNDASVRDYQTKAPQWTMGKNFDGTGSFGPSFVSADELAPGMTGARIETRLNGTTVQTASTSDMVFDVATLVSIISEVMTLEAGDVIVTGTPAGVGMARKPQLFMKHGDICEVEVEGLGCLTNRVTDQSRD